MSELNVENADHVDNNVKLEVSLEEADMTDKEWDADMELALLKAISQCKPVGIHKHFRIISVQKQFNQYSPVPCSIKEIWQRLGDFYGMEALDELEEEDEEREEEEEQDKKPGNVDEFSLPLEDYEQLISEHREDDQSISSVREEASPELPPAKRTRTSKRELSPANSVAESIASTPEPEEGKPSRRTGRGTRRSEATPEPVNSRSTNRRTGRSSSATARGSSKRQGTKRK